MVLKIPELNMNN